MSCALYSVKVVFKGHGGNTSNGFAASGVCSVNDERWRQGWGRGDGVIGRGDACAVSSVCVCMCFASMCVCVVSMSM